MLDLTRSVLFREWFVYLHDEKVTLKAASGTTAERLLQGPAPGAAGGTRRAVFRPRCRMYCWRGARIAHPTRMWRGWTGYISRVCAILELAT